MWDSLLESIDKGPDLLKGTGGLLRADVAISVIGSVAQFLDDRQIACVDRGIVFSPPSQLVGKSRMKPGVAPLAAEEPDAA
jgi:hypothetical protein